MYKVTVESDDGDAMEWSVETLEIAAIDEEGRELFFTGGDEGARRMAELAASLMLKIVKGDA